MLTTKLEPEAPLLQVRVALIKIVERVRVIHARLGINESYTGRYLGNGRIPLLVYCDQCDPMLPHEIESGLRRLGGRDRKREASSEVLMALSRN